MKKVFKEGYYIFLGLVVTVVPMSIWIYIGKLLVEWRPDKAEAMIALAVLGPLVLLFISIALSAVGEKIDDWIKRKRRQAQRGF